MATIIDLPIEVLWSIIEQLHGKTISICAQVCKHLAEIANNDSLWKNICHKKKWNVVAFSVTKALEHSEKSKSEKQKNQKKNKKNSSTEIDVINWKKVYKYITFDQKLKLQLLYDNYFFVHQHDLTWRTECKLKKNSNFIILMYLVVIEGNQLGPLPEEATVRGLVRHLTGLVRVERGNYLICNSI